MQKPHLCNLRKSLPKTNLTIMLKDKAREMSGRIESAIHSSRGKDVLLYLLFVAVAFVFWVFLSLDTQVQRDFEVPVELQEVPDSVTLINQPPSSLMVSVKGKDSQLLKFMWGKMSPMKIKWDETSDGGTTMTYSSSKLLTRVRDYFGNAVQVVSCRRDSINLSYTTLPGVKVKLVVQADIRPQIQYVLSGQPTADVDSVTIFSPSDIPHNLKFVSTEPIVKSGLKDTARYEVKVKPIAGMRIIPDKVTVTVPVEPLIVRKRTLRLEIKNLPPDKHLVTFPSKIEISYLVAMGSYNDEYPIRAFVDYNDIKLPGNKLPVSLSVIPEIYRNMSFSPESVEYIVENAD